MSDIDPTAGETGTPNDPDQGTGDSLTFSKDDFQKILKQNQHGQQFIDTLKSEKEQMADRLKALEEELQTKSSMEELLEQMRVQPNNPDQPGPTAPPVDESELLAKLEQQVFDKLTAQQQQAQQKQNWDSVVDALQAKHGEKYQDYVTTKAQELGLTQDQVIEMGATTPKALLGLMDVQSSTGPAPTRSSERAPNYDPLDLQETQYEKVARLQRNIETPEGREARQLWNDPTWQAQQRQRILDKARKEGSTFGNIIR